MDSSLAGAEPVVAITFPLLLLFKEVILLLLSTKLTRTFYV